MATPPPPGSTQTSSQSENQRGYNALFQAKDGVQRAQEDVKSVMGGLIRAYGGSDGTAFQSLLNEWSGQVDVITRSMSEMMQTLTETGQAQSRTQGEINDFIEAARRSSISVGTENKLNP
ncbi:WXG100 family type VII secretion target [Streptomyces sp. NPDC055103]